jgi:hypothetical protein
VDPVTNPFAPGAGQAPPALVGRDAELDSVRIALDRLTDRRPARGLVLVGVDGVGKTVLLDEIRRAASPDSSLAVGIEADPAGGIADTGDLEIDLTELLGELGATAAELGIGVALLIDELQDLDDGELGAVAGAIHDTNQQGLPVAVFGAGLPNLRTALANAKPYAERLFDVRMIGPLDDHFAAAALTEPTDELGVRWETDALRTTLDAAFGYPYFLQVYGKYVWDFAMSSPITSADARAGVEAGNLELEVSHFGARWKRTTPAQQQYLRALANVADAAGRAKTNAVGAVLGKSLGTLSSTRDQLLRRGIVYAPDRGTIAFTTPGMADFIARRH